MNFPWYIGRRYFSNRKKLNAVNLISWISVAGTLVGTASLVVVLSVFNGFEHLLNSLYQSFDPDLKVSSNEGKTFEWNDEKRSALQAIPGVVSFSEVIEEKALLRYRQREFVAVIKGVDSAYTEVTGIESRIVGGYYEHDPDLTAVGQGIAYYLSVDLDDYEPIYVMIPGKSFSSNSLSPDENFYTSALFPTGVFSVQADLDSRYIFSTLQFLEEMTETENKRSSLEIKIEKGREKQVKAELESLFGPGFAIENRYEQHAFMYKVMQTEKWAVFVIFIFIILIATFNMVGSLTMLILDKKHDMHTLFSLGATVQEIRRIFFWDGVLIHFSGALVGLGLGTFICWIQTRFGLLKMGNAGDFIVNTYPVVVQSADLIWVLLMVSAIGLIASSLTVLRIRDTGFKPA